MSPASPQALTITVDEAQRVSGLLQVPADARAGCTLAHGAGAGMTHPFMAAVADGLAQRRIATLRYQFPYMERGSKRPDSPALAQATVRTAVAHAAQLLPQRPLFAVGKSFGGRMTSQAQAEAPLAGVRGLVFFGFPLHPPGQPSDRRATHLANVHVPMLFLQGTRDEFADLALLRPVLTRLGTRATLHQVDDADHSFRVPARSGRRPEQVLAELLDTASAWMERIAADGGRR